MQVGQDDGTVCPVANPSCCVRRALLEGAGDKKLLLEAAHYVDRQGSLDVSAWPSR